MTPTRKRRKRWNKKPHTLWDKERKARYPLGAEVEARGNFYGKPKVKAGDRGYIKGRRTKRNIMLVIVHFGSRVRIINPSSIDVVDKNPLQRIKEQSDYYKVLTGE